MATSDTNRPSHPIRLILIAQVLRLRSAFGELKCRALTSVTSARRARIWRSARANGRPALDERGQPIGPSPINKFADALLDRGPTSAQCEAVAACRKMDISLTNE
jgi:hypothetical protein